MTGILIYGGTVTAFSHKAEDTVPIAGITMNHDFLDHMSGLDIYVSDISKLSQVELSKLMGSPQSDLDEICQKTLEAVRAGAKIIIWQEMALTLGSSVADTFQQEMKNLADIENIYLLISYERLLTDKEKKNKIMKNMSIFFTPDGNKAWEYAKAFPVAGLEEQFTEAGTKEIPYIDTPYGRIGQVICADMAIPYYIKQASEKKIDLLLVPSLDTIAFTPLFTFSSAFRAVEYGFTMVRITGDGQSTVIDPYYRQWAGQNSYEQGTMNFYTNVPVISINTFYARIGYIFPYIVVLFLISLIILIVVKAIKRY